MLAEVKAEIGRKGLKQREVARKLGITDDLLSKYIRGVRPMPNTIQVKITQILQRKKADLFP